jgi:hypothetical protein
MIHVVAKVQLSNSLADSHSQFTATRQRGLRIAMYFLAMGVMMASRCVAQGYDGPAQLPTASMATAMSSTPAPGAIIGVNAGDDLQSALNNAKCGDVVELQAGATFTGQFIVPAKNCDIHHWIWIRTSAPDSALPAEGNRATPCYAGIASLEGRPQYSCDNPANVMAEVQIQTDGDGPFQLAPGANFYRFIGLQLSRPAGMPRPGRLVSSQETSDHIIVDRSWLHGATQDETYVGVSLDGMTNGAVIDSYFSDFHCIALTGLCVDSQAIEGGISDTSDGPFLIQNNFLEAAGEAVLFGGGSAKSTPANIEIIGNHFWKPWQWMPGSQPFVGGANGNPFVVKNHLELKNAVRVLVQANLMENVWGGFTQSGYGILLTPKNQHRRHGGNGCPSCKVTDVTIRYDYVSHAGAGLQLATSVSGKGRNGGEALSGERWSIHDVVLDDISVSKYTGDGAVLQFSNSWKRNPLNSVTVNHITAFPDLAGNMMFVGNDVRTAPMYGLVFTNNLLLTTRYPVWNTGGGDSCSAKDVPLTTIRRCFRTYKFVSNGIIATPAEFPPSSWPASNLFPKTIADVDFTNYNNGDGGNYELLSTSRYKNAGTDGKDLGADIVGLNAALAGVE